MSDGCSNISQRTESIQEDVPPPPSNKKYSIIVEMDGVKGTDSSKWASRCGVLIRRHIPISYDDWTKVDVIYKNNLWKALMEMENPECKPTQAMAWKVAHTSKKNGEVIPCAAEKYLKKDKNQNLASMEMMV